MLPKCLYRRQIDNFVDFKYSPFSGHVNAFGEVMASCAAVQLGTGKPLAVHAYLRLPSAFVPKPWQCCPSLPPPAAALLLSCKAQGSGLNADDLRPSFRDPGYVSADCISGRTIITHMRAAAAAVVKVCCSADVCAGEKSHTSPGFHPVYLIVACTCAVYPVLPIIAKMLYKKVYLSVDPSARNNRAQPRPSHYYVYLVMQNPICAHVIIAAKWRQNGSRPPALSVAVPCSGRLDIDREVLCRERDKLLRVIRLGAEG